jgi:hypothetical protein
MILSDINMTENSIQHLVTQEKVQTTRATSQEILIRFIVMHHLESSVNGLRFIAPYHFSK